jgi:hypothetical protein
MAMAVTFTTFNGRIVSETRNGVHGDYLTNTSGNTIGLWNAVIADSSGERSWSGGSSSPFRGFEIPNPQEGGDRTETATAEVTETMICNSLLRDLEEMR